MKEKYVMIALCLALTTSVSYSIGNNFNNFFSTNIFPSFQMMSPRLQDRFGGFGNPSFYPGPRPSYLDSTPPSFAYNGPRSPYLETSFNGNQMRCGSSYCKSNEQCLYGMCITAGIFDQFPPNSPPFPYPYPSPSGSADGSCFSDQQCSEQQKCQQGVCRPGCSLVRCGFGAKCLHGSCISDTQQQPSEGFQTSCSEPRPDQKNCPTLYYIRAPDLSNCIVDQSGTRKGYSRDCQICKDPTVTTYKVIACQSPNNPFSSQTYY